MNRIGRALLAAGIALIIGAATLPVAVAGDGEWQSLPLPEAATPSMNNPLKGFYGWYGAGIVPGPEPAEHYFRLSWADLEPREGQYDFAALDRVLAKLAPGHRIAFGVMPLNTCCSTHQGLDVPADMPARLLSGFWITADPSPGRLGARVYVPDWNDPHYIERFQKLYEAIGRRYDGDRRIAWIDIRAYGNWGEGHLSGARGYQSGRIPYDDPAINTGSATPGTLTTRLALADAIVKALPRTRLLAMSDDKDVLLHLLKTPTAIPIGMRRDSWGAKMFETALYPAGLTEDDRKLVAERWKVAPFIVESFGATRVFEAGPAGIIEQIERQHVSAIGNGNFNARRWTDIPPDRQAALLKAGMRAGYSYAIAGIRYRRQADSSCGLAVDLIWANRGVAPPYEGWKAELWLKPALSGDRPIGPVTLDLPRLLPDDTGDGAEACFSMPAKPAGGSAELWLRVVDETGARTMELPLAKRDALGNYDLGTVPLGD